MRLSATATFTPSVDLANLIASKVSPAVRAAMEQSCTIVMDRAKQMCPVDTGRLRDSIDFQITEDAQLITGIIAPHTEYAGFVEFGTHKMAAQPYMRPALDSNRGEVTDIFIRNLEAAVE